MNVSWLHLALYLMLCGLIFGAAQKGENKGKGVFAPLEKGQKVGLKEIATGYEISAVAGVELAHTIKEVSSNYIVLEDIARLTETHIPIYSVKAVKIVRPPKK